MKNSIIEPIQSDQTPIHSIGFRFDQNINWRPIAVKKYEISIAFDVVFDCLCTSIVFDCIWFLIFSFFFFFFNHFNFCFYFLFLFFSFKFIARVSLRDCQQKFFVPVCSFWLLRWGSWKFCYENTQWNALKYSILFSTLQPIT